MLRANAPRIEIPRFAADMPLNIPHAQLLGKEILAYVLEASPDQSPTDMHNARSQAVVEAHQQRSRLFHVSLEDITPATGDSGFHYDSRQELGINVHTVLKGACHVALLRDRGVVTLTNPLYFEPQFQRLQKRTVDAWETRQRIDTGVIHPVIWTTELQAGETLVFPVGNNRPNSPGPRGAWHIFTSMTPDRTSKLNMYDEEQE